MTKKSKQVHIEAEGALGQMLASGDFRELDIELQKQIVDYNHEYHMLEAGMLGKLLGTKNTGIHVAFLLCLFFVLLAFVDMLYCYCTGNGMNIEFFKLIMPFITLSLGYIFGKGKDDS